MSDTFCAQIPTSLGVFSAVFTERGLASVTFPGQAERVVEVGGTRDQLVWLDVASDAINTVLAGRRPRAMPPLDWVRSTEFQRRVWKALQGIPLGETRQYADVARELGCPGAARAVGQACGANPIPVLVPCHRVLAAGGTLGGFSAGLEWKRRLLALEGCHPPRNKR
jgi:methylated-DNA-[protein]-cysteine S-methyltransferase